MKISECKKFKNADAAVLVGGVVALPAVANIQENDDEFIAVIKEHKARIAEINRLQDQCDAIPQTLSPPYVMDGGLMIGMAAQIDDGNKALKRKLRAARRKHQKELDSSEIPALKAEISRLRPKAVELKDLIRLCEPKTVQGLYEKMLHYRGDNLAEDHIYRAVVADAQRLAKQAH